MFWLEDVESFGPFFLFLVFSSGKPPGSENRRCRRSRLFPSSFSPCSTRTPRYSGLSSPSLPQPRSHLALFLISRLCWAFSILSSFSSFSLASSVFSSFLFSGVRSSRSVLLALMCQSTWLPSHAGVFFPSFVIFRPMILLRLLILFSFCRLSSFPCSDSTSNVSVDWTQLIFGPWNCCGALSGLRRYSFPLQLMFLIDLEPTLTVFRPVQFAWHLGISTVAASRAAFLTP